MATITPNSTNKQTTTQHTVLHTVQETERMKLQVNERTVAKVLRTDKFLLGQTRFYSKVKIWMETHKPF